MHSVKLRGQVKIHLSVFLLLNINIYVCEKKGEHHNFEFFQLRVTQCMEDNQTSDLGPVDIHLILYLFLLASQSASKHCH